MSDNMAYVTNALGKFIKECEDEEGREAGRILFEDYHIRRIMYPEMFHRCVNALTRKHFNKTAAEYIDNEN